MSILTKDILIYFLTYLISTYIYFDFIFAFEFFAVQNSALHRFCNMAFELLLLSILNRREQSNPQVNKYIC